MNPGYILGVAFVLIAVAMLIFIDHEWKQRDND
jgi:hypothetical protein